MTTKIKSEKTNMAADPTAELEPQSPAPKSQVAELLTDCAGTLQGIIEILKSASGEIAKITGKPHDIDNLTHAHQVITKQAIPMVTSGMAQLWDILEKYRVR